jgi:hypothetical protein
MAQMENESLNKSIGIPLITGNQFRTKQIMRHSEININ